MHLHGHGRAKPIPHSQVNMGDLNEKKAPADIPYTNPMSYLTIFQQTDGKLNIIGIGAVVLGAWVAIRLLNG